MRVSRSASEGFCEALARQNTAARLFQRQLGLRRRHTWVSVFQSSSQCPKGHYLGRCMVYLGTSAHRPCLDLSVYHLSVHHSSVHLISWPIRLPALLFPASPTTLDSLVSELWYHLGCRPAALASSSTSAVGQSFRQLFTTRSALQG